jgi:hypothetical protein
MANAVAKNRIVRKKEWMRISKPPNGVGLAEAALPSLMR